MTNLDELYNTCLSYDGESNREMIEQSKMEFENRVTNLIESIDECKGRFDYHTLRRGHDEWQIDTSNNDLDESQLAALREYIEYASRQRNGLSSDYIYIDEDIRF